ncbi:MAG: hypothetical protein AAF626_04880 [Pseudomonadota bacterium]
MTVGIAATGPFAGASIISGLRAVEAVGRGAIGGFVSLAALTQDQHLIRAETQNGGAQALFDGDVPERLSTAPFAALISSGPDRPPPLSQFVAAMPGVGLVTGHRFPHLPARGGKPLNETILAAMQSGLAPKQAIDQVIADNPDVDAGFIALSVSGNIGLGNMPSVRRRHDQGEAMDRCEDIGASVAVLHNAILPHKPIAELAAEVILDQMRLRGTRVHKIHVSAGLTLRFSRAPEIHVDAASRATEILHPAAQVSVEERAFGMGDSIRVVQHGKTFGWLAQEPFMILKSGVLISLDGKQELELPVHQVQA